jgi:hypothetical protein
MTVFLRFLLFVCLPAVIDFDPGSKPNIITSILSCNLLASSSTGRPYTGTSPTIPLLTPVGPSIFIVASARRGGCGGCFGFVAVVIGGFVSINNCIRHWTGIRFAFFTVFAGEGKIGSNPAPKTGGVFGYRS